MSQNLRLVDYLLKTLGISAFKTLSEETLVMFTMMPKEAYLLGDLKTKKVG